MKRTAPQFATNQAVKARMDRVAHSFVMEQVKDQMVTMTYDVFYNAFSYYAAAPNHLRFSDLEVVARKFVNAFNCAPLYVPKGAEFYHLKELSREEKEKLTCHKFKYAGAVAPCLQMKSKTAVRSGIDISYAQYKSTQGVHAYKRRKKRKKKKKKKKEEK